ncbi:MAG TPA: hypothetical protein VFW25_08530 [Silvibacterium sp.]|nr:hypothetical protein [Silvibacterium sp.]
MSIGNVISDAGQAGTPAGNPQPHYDLRPLSTGEVLDRTFQIYRSRFALFAGLALLPAAVNVIVTAIRLVYTAHQSAHVHSGLALYRVQGVTGLLLIAASLISFVLYGIMHAATTWAVSSVYLGEIASIKAAYRVGFRHWFRYTVIMLRQVWASIWLFMVLLMAAVLTSVAARRVGGGLGWLTILLIVLAGLSLIYGMWAYFRISLAVPAAVVESSAVRASLRRSAQLLASRKVRIFLLFLLLLALYIVVGMIQSPLAILTMRAHGAQAFVSQGINLAVSFVAATLIGPVWAIGVCLFYFDERVRREGFDIEWMMRKLAPADPIVTEPPALTQENSVEPA